MDDDSVIKAMKLSWLQHLDVVGVGIVAVSIMIALIGLYLDAKSLLVLPPLAVAANFLLRWFQIYYFYEHVKCNECGARLNYFKNGNKVPSEQAWRRLRKGIACRVCGWKPIV
jgi:hypothetical protein